MLIEQGQTFTVVQTRRSFGLAEAERDDPAAAFVSARRVWLPAAPGADWLHDGAAEIVGPTGVGYAIDTRRQSAEIGAGGGFLEVALLLYLAENTEIGRRLQGELYEWVKRHVVERRKETGYEDADPAPDFSTFDSDQLARGLKAELADVTKVPEVRLELVREECGAGPPMLHEVVYRDVKTGREYLVEVGHDDVTFSAIER